MSEEKNELLVQIKSTEAMVEYKIQDISEKQKEIDCFELDQDNYIDQYDDYLDDVYGDFMGMNASRILQQCDPIAYRVGISDYLDGLSVSDDDEYQTLETELEELETELEDLQETLEELEIELEELEE